MKKYKLNGVRICQDELTLAEYEKVKDVLRGKAEVFTGDSQKFGEYLDKLHESGLLVQLVPLIIKRYEKTAFQRYLNDRALKKLGVTWEEWPKTLKATDLAQLMVDFFLFNLAWTTNLLMLPESSDSKSPTILKKSLTVLSKLFTPSAKATSSATSK